MRLTALVAPAILLAALPTLAHAADASQCTNLQRLQLDHAHVLSAEVIAPGAFTPPPDPDGKVDKAPIFAKLPSFCRVVVEATPSDDSQINIEVWLPLNDGNKADWNGRFQGQGNGGFAGSIDYQGLARAIDASTATAGTDTGHFADGIDARWALNHPEKVADYGWRGIHQMTVQAKAVVDAYYGSAAKHSYFTSCSDGGREALMEAQRFPADYDGILAGAPAYAWTSLLTSAALGMQTLLTDDASYIPAAKVPAIAHAIVVQCDKVDGVKDGLIADPRACHFDPAILACKSAENAHCLTAPQIKSLNTMLTDRKVGDTMLPGFLPTGAEEDPNGWPSWVTGSARGKSAGVGFATGYFANMVYSDPKWDFHTFEPVAGLATAREKTGENLNATNTDLSAFHARGGKLIMYHGWADAAISPLYSIHYYEGVEEKLGKDTAAEFTRLYMLPGVKHCFGGPGPDSIGQFGLPGIKNSTAGNNVILALEDWVEQGKAPEAIVATKYAKPRKENDEPHAVVMTRPACPYPQQAQYKGTGSTKEAASFVCK